MRGPINHQRNRAGGSAIETRSVSSKHVEAEHDSRFDSVTPISDSSHASFDNVNAALLRNSSDNFHRRINSGGSWPTDEFDEDDDVDDAEDNGSRNSKRSQRQRSASFFKRVLESTDTPLDNDVPLLDNDAVEPRDDDDDVDDNINGKL